jgi:hypothetical protein
MSSRPTSGRPNSARPTSSRRIRFEPTSSITYVERFNLKPHTQTEKERENARKLFHKMRSLSLHNENISEPIRNFLLRSNQTKRRNIMNALKARRLTRKNKNTKRV